MGLYVSQTIVIKVKLFDLIGWVGFILRLFSMDRMQQLLFLSDKSCFVLDHKCNVKRYMTYGP